ncbi:hypothetical protein FOMPIDRAFT_88700 [Fomitopsis schrenkii]|uniref:Uncharacterized protein n=1 Tax=Fomitopsis schrenkii TaxID=2126942 RepID=S8F4C8_FOMSC|nr:hypothetical protein FOMPIDRAFT_88700 [Fomitopsis schrenkii]
MSTRSVSAPASASASAPIPAPTSTFGAAFDQTVRDWIMQHPIQGALQRGDDAIVRWVDEFASIWARYLMRVRGPADELLTEFVWTPLMTIVSTDEDRAVRLADEFGLDILHSVVANFRDMEAQQTAIDAQVRREEEEAARRREEEEAARRREDQTVRARAVAQEAVKVLSAQGALLNKNGRPVVAPSDLMGTEPEQGEPSAPSRPRRSLPRRVPAPPHAVATKPRPVAAEGDLSDVDDTRAAPRPTAKSKVKAKASSQAAARAATKSEVEALFVERLKCRAEALYEDLRVCDYCATYAKTAKECKVEKGATACTACLEAHKGCYWGNASLSGTRPDTSKTAAPAEKSSAPVVARSGLRSVVGPPVVDKTYVLDPARLKEGVAVFSRNTFADAVLALQFAKNRHLAAIDLARLELAHLEHVEYALLDRAGGDLTAPVGEEFAFSYDPVNHATVGPEVEPEVGPSRATATAAESGRPRKRSRAQG